MIAAPQIAVQDKTDLIARLRNLLVGVELDCDCRLSLCEAIDRFAALEHRRVARSRLAQARDQKDRIVAILVFLAEIDQITETEADRTVFEEMALLFIEIANCANAGAASLQTIAPV